MGTAKWLGLLLLSAGYGFAWPVLAEGDGWYAVAFGGESNAKNVISRSSVDQAVIDAFASVGLTVVDADSSLSDSDTAFGATLGYKVNDNFAAELSYVDLGAIDYRASGTVTDGVTVFDATLHADATASGPVLSFLGILPIGERFAAYGRVGIALMDTEARVNLSIDGTSDSFSDSTQRSNMMYGIGGEFSVSERFGIRVEWNRYANIGSDDVTGEGDVDLFSAALRMNFH